MTTLSRQLGRLAWFGLVILSPGTALAATLQVGPQATFTTIADAWAQAKPGDIIEVQGDHTYPGSILLTNNNGTAGQPITVRGIAVNGKRPTIKGIGPGQWDNMAVWLNGNHMVFEGFEVIGAGDPNGSDYCILHMADDVVVRDVVVHDCLHQGGLVGNDSGSGSLLLEYSEFYGNGNSEYSHQIYMATDQEAFPHSTFRMQYCYIHDGLGGNNVASRSERNEIYYNWIEGAYYHELDLIGPDVGGNPRRCDSDVVGNVLWKTSTWRIARIGGDGSGDSMGRFRFVNNTMILAATTPTVIGLQFTVSTVEMYNNTIYAPKAGAKIYEIDDQSGPAATFFGSNNWVVTGTVSIPSAWTSTFTGADPQFVAIKSDDLRPQTSSPLVGKSTATTAATGSLAFPNPLMAPAFNPPDRCLLPVGGAEARAASGALSVGAYEPSAAPPSTFASDGGDNSVFGDGGTIPWGGGGSAGAAGGGGVSGGGSGGGGKASSSGGCKCRMGAEPGQEAGWIGVAVALGVVAGRRRRASKANVNAYR